jgi:superfamily II DNA or RNA helicase
MQALVAAVRKAALPAIWSQGVKLARERAVAKASAKGGEVVLRVRAPGQAVPPTVTLYVDDLEWSCDCDAKTDPCAHVAAAAIALSQGEAGDEAAPERGSSAAAEAADAVVSVARPARLVYRFGTRERRLVLSRVVVHSDGREEKLAGPLASDIARRAGPGAAIDPTHEDVLVDRILSSARGAIPDAVPTARIKDVLSALADARAEATLDGAAITLSGEPIRPVATLDDGPKGGFVLRVDRDPSITSVVALGVARCGDVLRPLGDTATTGETLEKLPLERVFARTEQGELVGRVLPELEKTIEVDVRTRRLATKTRALHPRLAFDLSHHGHTLSILPTLVYGDPPIARVDGEAIVTLGKEVPTRRVDEEKALVYRLRDELNLVPGRRVHFDGHDASRFAGKLRAFQARTHGVEPAELQGRALVARVLTGDGFDVVFEEEGADGAEAGAGGDGGDGGDGRGRRTAESSAVLRAWRDGLDLVPLDGGGWAEIPREWLARHGHRVADLLAARDEAKKVPAALLPELGALCEELEAPPPLGLAKLAPLLEGFERIPHAALPADLRADLRPYQRVGVDWLVFLREAGLGAVLADDMGLGKTLQTIAALSGRVLVVCPKSVVYNWEAEIARFRPSLRTAIYHGLGRELDRAADVTLTTYAVLRLDLEHLAGAGQEWDVVVLDEAQAIKNPASQTARAAFALRAKLRIALSGTPVENHLEELWSVMHFANPGLLGGKSDFDERYTSAIARGDAGAGGRLRAKIRPFILRRMKRDVLPELPARTDAVLHVALEDTERAVYDAVRAATRKEVAEKLSQGGGVLAALEALLRLRQAACHPSLVPGQQAASSSKIDRLLEALEESTEDGHKALVFSQWTSLLDLVEPHLQNAGISFTRLDGSTRDRGAVVSAFSAPDGPPVMLVSLKAGGTGLNLTAADHVFLLDPWWNPAVEDQAADRAHRIGQDKPVMVYRMVAKDTVEEGILALQERKRAIADVALGGADQAGGVTRDELLALLA